jgi:hypothetical protein
MLITDTKQNAKDKDKVKEGTQEKEEDKDKHNQKDKHNRKDIQKTKDKDRDRDKRQRQRQKHGQKQKTKTKDKYKDTNTDANTNTKRKDEGNDKERRETFFWMRVKILRSGIYLKSSTNIHEIKCSMPSLCCLGVSCIDDVVVLHLLFRVVSCLQFGLPCLVLICLILS